MPQNDWSVVWLAVGAISLALMALLQIGAVIALLMAVKEAMKTMKGVQAQVAPLIDRGQALISSANDVVSQAQSVVASAATQVKRVEGAVAVAAAGISDLRQSVSHVSAQAKGAGSAVSGIWSAIRASVRGGLRRDEPGTRRGDEPRGRGDFTDWETGGS